MEYIKHLGIVLPEKKTFFKNSIKCTLSEDCIWVEKRVLSLNQGKDTPLRIWYIFFFHFPVIMLVVKWKKKVANHIALNSHDMSWNSFLHTCIIYLLQTEFHSCCSHSTCWYGSFSVQLSPKYWTTWYALTPSWIRTKYLISLMDTSLQ